MKKIIKYSIVVIVLFTIGYLVFSTIKKINHKKQVEENIKSIPEFCFNDLWEGEICNTILSKENACIIIYFNPDCSHCQYEAEQLFLNQGELKNYQIIMVSPSPSKEITDFSEKYHLNEFSNFIFLYDKDEKFTTIFGSVSVPTRFIYNKDGQLVKKFIGEVDIKILLKHLST